MFYIQIKFIINTEKPNMPNYVQLFWIKMAEFITIKHYWLMNYMTIGNAPLFTDHKVNILLAVKFFWIIHA